MFSVVRAGCGFGMILHRDDRERFVAQALDAAVIEVDVGHFDFRRQAVGLHGKSVVVRSDFHMAIAEILNGLITAAMSKDKFESLTAKSASQQLMAEANTEGGQA